MSVYESLGLRRVINASGSVTRLGGAPMPSTVLNAFAEAARESIPLEEVQAAASKMISQVTGAESGLVTAGSAAGLTLGAAAIMAGYNPARMEQLPDTTGIPNEFIVAREHRNGYDHAVRLAGAKLVEVGMNEVTAGAGVRHAEAWEYAAAFNKNTAGVLYVYTATSQPPLEEVIAVARAAEVPVLVDAAGELPPRANLMLPSVTGADLVSFSGGKAIRGPQSTGILAGQRDLIASAALQMLDMDDHFALWDPPADFIDKSKVPGMPRHGIGRPMKVSKEEIVALITALAMFSGGEYLNDLEAFRAQLETIAAALADSLVRCDIRESSDGESPPVLEITLLEGGSDDALGVCQKLRKGSPAVYVGHGQLSAGKLIIHPLCLNEGDAEIVGQRIKEVVAG